MLSSIYIVLLHIFDTLKTIFERSVYNNFLEKTFYEENCGFHTSVTHLYFISFTLLLHFHNLQHRTCCLQKKKIISLPLLTPQFLLWHSVN